MMVFCTIFDSYYLDKGIVMYESLTKVTDDFKLYIFAFDDVAYNVLNARHMDRAVIVKREEFEAAYPVLERLKQERSKAEYCWTCTPASIEYVLDHYGEAGCTYIDADLYFFSDPQVLFDEVKDGGEGIIITPHRFSNSRKDQHLLKRSGRYCVEFNYFDTSEEARRALSWWKEKCFEWCFHIYEEERMGDQKYLEKFPALFKGVHELSNLGGGVAPWNLAQYEYTGKRQQDGAMVLREKNAGRMQGNGAPILKEKKTGREFPVVFYHFQSMRYVSSDLIIVRSETHSKKTKDVLYRPYLIELEKIRKDLKAVGVSFDVKQSYASNPLIRFLQKYVLRFKLKSLTDLYDLRKLRG
jgi:hypothetical protein